MNWKLYNKLSAGRCFDARDAGVDTFACEKDFDRLDRYRQMYDNLAEFRRERKRNIAFSFGDQWSETIPDPEHPGRYISEEAYIKRQGAVPLVNNVIRKYTKSILGFFRNNKNEPMAVARDRDEQKISEMASIALQYAHQVNELQEVDTRSLEELLLSGLCIQGVRYRKIHERDIYDVQVEQINPDYFFCNSDISDSRAGNLRTIGVLRDMPVEDVIAEFAGDSLEKETEIRRIYTGVSSWLEGYSSQFTKKNERNSNFYLPEDSQSMCRVIEVWNKESKRRLEVHDTLAGKLYVAELADRDYIKRLNLERINEATAQGVDADKVPLMVVSEFIHKYWSVEYFAPTGEVLRRMETPFSHKTTPYELCLHSVVDGQLHSFVGDLIDPQRFVNRYITKIDMAYGTAAKGLLMFPKSQMGDLTKQEIADEVVRPNGVITYDDTVTSQHKPYILSHEVVHSGELDIIRMNMDMLDQISGVQSALQGERPTAGTPASLYAQESQNASNNIVDLIETFNGFRRRRDYKMLKLIQQYYDSPRYINIAGKDYQNESKWYSPEKVRNSEFDVMINETVTTPAFRQMADNWLIQMLQMKAIDPEMYFELSSLPFADRAKEMMKRKKEEAMQAGVEN